MPMMSPECQLASQLSAQSGETLDASHMRNIRILACGLPPSIIACDVEYPRSNQPIRIRYDDCRVASIQPMRRRARLICRIESRVSTKKPLRRVDRLVIITLPAASHQSWMQLHLARHRLLIAIEEERKQRAGAVAPSFGVKCVGSIPIDSIPLACHYLWAAEGHTALSRKPIMPYPASRPWQAVFPKLSTPRNFAASCEERNATQHEPPRASSTAPRQPT